MLNHITIMGRLTADAELRQTQSGIPVARFSVAVERPRRKDAPEQITDFIRCVAWRQTAEFVTRYFCKGAMIALEGRLAIDNYTDRDGNKREAANVVVEQVHFTGERRNDQGGGGYQQQPQAYQQNGGGYQQPQAYQRPAQQPAQQPGGLQIGNLEEFEDILSYGELPF